MSGIPGEYRQPQPSSQLGRPSGFASLGQLLVIGNGRYQIMHLHASGGMARIYRALDTRLGHEVAVKVLAPEFMDDAVRVERFRLEARRVAALNHPQIVPLLEYGEEGNVLYLVMPFYPHTLRDAFEKRKAFALADAVGLASEVAAALDYAHQLGIIHRDVKPENILLDESGYVRLGDFGIAKADASAPAGLATGMPLAMAETGRSPLLSLEYTAPEFLMGQRFDRRVDVYGLGIVVYEMLTGRVPFPLEGEETSAVIMRMLTEPATPPSLLAPVLLPFTIDAVVLGALERDPRQRFGSAGAFSRALQATLYVPVGTIPHDYPSRPPFRSVPLRNPYVTVPLRRRRGFLWKLFHLRLFHRRIGF
jgi:eukaryotic-like serine/threonine-protein kinase